MKDIKIAEELQLVMIQYAPNMQF